MTKSRFNSLKKSEKLRYLRGYAVPIAWRRVMGFPVRLHQTDFGYVETFHLRKSNTPWGFRSFVRLEKLQPYLDLIDLQSLLPGPYQKRTY